MKVNLIHIFFFVIKTLQLVLQEMEKETEEASCALGTTNWQTFPLVILPPLIKKQVGLALFVIQQIQKLRLRMLG